MGQKIFETRQEIAAVAIAPSQRVMKISRGEKCFALNPLPTDHNYLLTVKG